jgi:hypothetical protein
MKTVAIVGSNDKTRDLAPWTDPSKDIWLMNTSPAQEGDKAWVKRVDAMFEMHKPENYMNPENLDAPYYWKWLQAPHEFNVWMQGQVADVPSSKMYPLNDVSITLMRHVFKGDREVRHFYTSTVVYALALAIFTGYKRIELYGVEMTQGTEYAYQRDALFFWIGKASGLGIDVCLPEGCSLFDVPLYGYDDKEVIKPAEFKARLIELTPDAKRLKHRVDKLAARLSRRLGLEVLQEYQAALQEYGQVEGAYAENNNYVKQPGVERAFLEFRCQALQLAIRQFDQQLDKTMGKMELAQELKQVEAAKGLIRQYNAHLYNKAQYAGALSESQRYLVQLSPALKFGKAG